MKKTLMSATALCALVMASTAFAQTQAPAADPFAGSPPAAAEPAPGMEAQPATPTPEAAAPAMPQSQAEVPTLPPPENAAPPSEQVSGPAEMFIQQQRPGEMLASSLIGSTVEDPAGEPLGDINDVVLTDQGIVDGVVIGVGGFLGIGEKEVAVSFDAIKQATDADGNIVLTLNTTAGELESAPQYVKVAGLRQDQMPERSLPPQESAPTTGR